MLGDWIDGWCIDRLAKRGGWWSAESADGSLSFGGVGFGCTPATRGDGATVMWFRDTDFLSWDEDANPCPGPGWWEYQNGCWSEI